MEIDKQKYEKEIREIVDHIEILSDKIAEDHNALLVRLDFDCRKLGPMSTTMVECIAVQPTNTTPLEQRAAVDRMRNMVGEALKKEGK